MLDSYNREINYLRISVTDRCNLRCRYCYTEDTEALDPLKTLLTFEEIVSVVKNSMALGIKKVRLTGGEPLMRRDIDELVAMIAKVDGVIDLAMTTNGVLLEKYAQKLKDAGLNRINISLDAIDAEKYAWITRGGDVNKVFAGIRAAKEAGLYPIKLNCVVERDPENEKDAKDVKAYAKENGLCVRFIYKMSLKEGKFSVVEGGTGGDCEKCNKIRLSSDGKIYPCLFNDFSVDTENADIKETLVKVISNKPQKGEINTKVSFFRIGG